MKRRQTRCSDLDLDYELHILLAIKPQWKTASFLIIRKSHFFVSASASFCID